MPGEGTMSAFYQKHFLKLLDFTPAEITALLELAAKLKADKKNGIEVQKLAGKNIALIFEKDSTRTRCSFEVAAFDQGARVTYLGPAAARLAIKSRSKTPPACSGGCTTAFSIAATARKWWRPWRNMPACRYGTA
jgi:ornithine carbamoyltransferase